MDYTAFGEEINANVGMRTTVQGFNAPNKLDEKYALTERDKATGLDHTWFRKLENQGGRWTSPDPYNGSMSLGDPQSFNRYSYVNNQPTNFIDPSGLQLRYFDVRQGMGCVFDERDGKFHCTEYINRYWYDDGTGSGGSGGEEFFGGGSGGNSGGGGENKPKCTISVRGNGNFTPQSAGIHPESNTLGTGSGSFQASFWVEIQGKISAYSPKVSVNVGQTSVTTGTFFSPVDNVIHQYDNYPVHDDTPNKSRQYNDGKGNIGFVDAPGLETPFPRFVAQHQKFTSYVTINGKRACSIDWTVDTYIFNGVVSQVFNAGSSY